MDLAVSIYLSKSSPAHLITSADWLKIVINNAKHQVPTVSMTSTPAGVTAQRNRANSARSFVSWASVFFLTYW